jgi:hypothetical protein
MRAITLVMTAMFILSGAMTVATTVQAQEDSKTVIKHDDGDKTVIKKKDDMSGEKKVIIHKHDD